jgi:hypothetical protein
MAAKIFKVDKRAREWINSIILSVHNTQFGIFFVQAIMVITKIFGKTHADVSRNVNCKFWKERLLYFKYLPLKMRQGTTRSM